MNSVVNLAMAEDSGVGRIAFIDLKAQQTRIRKRIEARLSAVLDHGKYIAGPEITELEDLLAARTGASDVVACASGTAALIIPLLAEGIGQGDAVFLPAFTYNATANAVILSGATPIFVDIDPATFNLDAEDLSRRVDAVKKAGSLRPACIIAVDLFGAPANYEKISKIAAADNMFLMADAAQSFGARSGDTAVGALAPATATSFFPGKALGAYGDAGAVFATDPVRAERWRSIRWHGTDDARKTSVRVGFNGRMDSFQAAVLLEKLAIFDDELRAREKVAERYVSALQEVCTTQSHVPGSQSGHSYFAVRVKSRDQVASQLKARGVPTAIYYSTPLHKMPAFEAFAPKGGLPNTDAVASDILALPMHPYLSEAQVEYICNAMTDTLSSLE